MLRVLAGDLSTNYTLDNSHFHHYMANQPDKVEKICEQLLLHDQVLVPTYDFLTALALMEILGENIFIELLESQQLRFIRLRQVIGYTRNSGRDGALIVFGDPTGQRATDSPLESAIAAAMEHSRVSSTTRKRISDLLASSSYEIDSGNLLSSIGEQTYSDFRRSSFWNSAYSYHRTAGLRLPGLAKNSVKVLGTEPDVLANPVDALLSLAQANIEIHLSQRFDCVSTSSGSPIGDSLALKMSNQQYRRGKGPDDLWSFLRLEGIPDLAAATCVEPEKFSDLLRLSRSRNCKDFRIWFSQNRHLSEMELCARYIELLHEIPWVSKTPIKALRFLITTVAGKLADANGLIGAGEAIGFLDGFLVDKLQGRSPKYFVSDLKKFQGKIGRR